MFKLRNFVADTRGDALKSIAFTAGVIAVASLALSHLLDNATRTGSLPQIAIVASPSPDYSKVVASLPRPTETSASNAARFDTAPVGTIAGRPMPQVVLDPCSGQQR